MSRPLLRLAVVAGAAAATVGLTALPALAHVTVSSPGATQGGYGVLTFRVPTESDTASTTGLKVQFPADQPLTSLRVKPKAGWTYTITRAKLDTPIESHGRQVTDYPSVVEWKATAGGVKPTEFEEFQVSVGPLPEAAEMTFKAIQAYGDGSVVSWIEETPEGGDEPEHPAPTLTLAAAGTEAAGTQPAAGEVASGTAAEASGDAPSRGSVVGAYVVGGVGLAVGLAGLALAAAARRGRATVGGSPSGTGAS